jgi:hypothetical protein
MRARAKSVRPTGVSRTKSVEEAWLSPRAGAWRAARRAHRQTEGDDEHAGVNRRHRSRSVSRGGSYGGNLTRDGIAGRIKTDIVSTQNQ